MKAVICTNEALRVEERPDPVPDKGHVLVEVLRCGICGSDLHARRHCNHWSDVNRRAGLPGFMRSDQEVIMGHEFCAEVLEYGPACKQLIKPGTRVCAVPILRRNQGIDLVGFSERSGGAYAERMLLEESMMMPVPNGLSADMATLTEPMSVAKHAVHRGELKKKDVAIVIGCGPVGLAVICLLKALGIKTVLASDFSAGRRALAEQCGADVVVDPANESPYGNWQEFGFIGGLTQLYELGLSTRDRTGATALPWWHVWRIAEKLGGAPQRPIIFECVGVPGLLKNVIDGAPHFSRVVVVGLCMEIDTIEPALAIKKEIDLRFVFGYSPLEYRDTLHMIAEGKVNCAPLITGTVGLDGVCNAFDALGNAELHAKILIDPSSQVTQP